MRSLVTIAAALCCVSGVAVAQKAKPRVVLLHPGAPSQDSEAIVIPAGSAMRLVSFPRDAESNATFRGRFTVTGTYEVEVYGEDASATLWPDRESLKKLPHWRDRGGADELDIDNGWEFARAVVAADNLQKLKAGKLASVRGRVTIVADDYSTSIECDVAHFSARFVSVVKVIRIAASPKAAGEC